MSPFSSAISRWVEDMALVGAGEIREGTVFCVVR